MRKREKIRGKRPKTLDKEEMECRRGKLKEGKTPIKSEKREGRKVKGKEPKEGRKITSEGKLRGDNVKSVRGREVERDEGSLH